MDYDVLNEFVKDALNFAEIISEKYQYLKKLEEDGLRDFDLFVRFCEELNACIKKENFFYKTADFNDEEIEYMISYVAINNNVDVDVSLEKLMHARNQSFLSAYRVIFKLDNIVKKEYIDEEIDDECIYHVKYQKNLLLNYLLVVESIVDDYLSLERDKSQLLYIKYLLPYINENTEEVFLKEYKFDRTLYLNHKMYGDILKISDMIQEQYKLLQLYNKFVDEVCSIIEIEDTQFDNSYEDICISEIIIKSVVVFFDDDYINNAISEFDEFVSTTAAYFNNRKAIGNILNIPEIIKKDKSNYSYLSLRLPK